MARTKGYKPSRHGDFVAWVWRRCATEYATSGKVIAAARLARTSTSTVTMWQASATTTFAAADRKNPDVAAALILGFDVVRRDAIGDTRRKELGSDVFVLREYHAPGGQSRKQIGVVLRVGQSFFIYLLSSAREANLWAETSDRQGNAVTEIISMVIREMTRFGRQMEASYRPHLYAREHARVVRDERHGADLKKTLVDCRTVAHIPHTMDLAEPAAAQAFSFGSILAASHAASVIEGTHRAEVVIQANGGFYEDIKVAPFTHGPKVVLEQDARTGSVVKITDNHRLGVTEDEAAAKQKLRLLVDRILETSAEAPGGGCDWHAVGVLMAELGLPSRLPANRKHGRLLRDTDPAGWAGAAKSLFGQRWIEGWRTGGFAKEVRQKIELSLEGLDLPRVEDEDGGVLYACRIDMPLPDGGWGVTDEEWQRVLEIRYPAGRTPRTHTGEVLPFAGTGPWRGERGMFKLISRSDRYVLFVGPENHTNRAWAKWAATADRVATVRSAEWHQSIATAAQRALDGLSEDVLPLWSEPAAAVAAQASVTDEAVEQELRDRLGEAEARAEGALDTFNERRAKAKKDRSEGAASGLRRAEAALERAEAEVEELEMKIARLGSVPTSPAHVVEAAEAVTATAEFVIAALATCPGSAPGWLQRACTILFRDIRIEPADAGNGQGRGELAWSCTLVVPVRTDDGAQRQASLPLSGTVFNRANLGALADGSPSPGPEAWAWQYFYRGASMQEIAAASGGIDGSGAKNSYLYKGVSTWACQVVPESTLVNALLDCPVAETRRVIWWAVTGDDASVRGLDDGFVRHIRATYTSAAQLQTWGWCHESHDLARAVCDHLLAVGGEAAMVDVAEALGVPHEALLALTRVNGTSRSGEVKVRARLAVSPFQRNWARSTRWMAVEDKRLALRECPHADCPERLRGGRPFASHVLGTPETVPGHGVLCPSCRRLPVPALEGVRFPTAYLRPWSGRYGTRSKARQRQAIGTHLDPGRPDPGPGAALPDNGARPRPETRVNRPGGHVAKELRTGQLRGRLVLLLGLDSPERERLSELVEGCGGRVASKLRESVACVVAPASVLNGPDPRVARAARVGIPSFTPAVFEAKVNEGWRPPAL